jgi:Ca2+-transporting ATPase
MIGVASFLFFIFVGQREVSLAYAQTATFTFMAVAQLMHVFNVRREKQFGLDRSLSRNKVLIGALLLSLTLQFMAVYMPFLNGVLGTVPLEASTWIMILVVASIVTLLVNLVKKYGRLC